MKNHPAILLVEDDADDVYFISRALRSSGLEPNLSVVHNGQDAVEFLMKAGQAPPESDSPHPCLLLLDLNLPRKHGLEVLKWLRAEEKWKTIIVIVLTSSTSENDMNEAYRLGANSYVIKPADATRLSDLAEFIKGYWFGWNQLPPVCRAFHRLVN